VLRKASKGRDDRCRFDLLKDTASALVCQRPKDEDKIRLSPAESALQYVPAAYSLELVGRENTEEHPKGTRLVGIFFS
jgi:hypothetical protein